MASTAKKLGFLIPGVIATVVAVLAGGFYWTYGRVPPVIAYNGVHLGMSEGELLVSLGRPPDCLMGDQKIVKIMSFTRNGTACDTRMTMERNSSGAWQVVSICGPFRPEELKNMSFAANEGEVLDKLGEPAASSIRADGLAKVSSFTSHNLAVTFSGRQSIEWCVTKGLPLKYTEEFKDG